MKTTSIRVLLLLLSMCITGAAYAAGGVVKSPTGTAPDRYVYYPGTEALTKGEIRLTACGTGLPAARRDQAATCFLAELGNGDKLLFDVGTGSMMRTIKPGHAVGYHFFNEEATRDTVYEGVREIYDGPLSLATDNMVWNITKGGVKTRMAVSPGEAWSVPGPNRPPKPPAPGTVPDPMSDAVKAGRWDVSDAQGPMIKEFKKAHGMK